MVAMVAMVAVVAVVGATAVVVVAAATVAVVECVSLMNDFPAACFVVSVALGVMVLTLPQHHEC